MTYRLSFQPQNEPPPIPASEDAPSSLPITSAAQSREAKLLGPITHHGNIYLSSILRHFLNHQRLPPPASIHTFIASMPLDSTSLPFISFYPSHKQNHNLSISTTLLPSTLRLSTTPYPTKQQPEIHKRLNPRNMRLLARLSLLSPSPRSSPSQHSTYTFKLPPSSGLEIKADASASSLAVKIKVRQL